MLLLLLEEKATRGRVRTPKAFAKPNTRLARISHEVPLECDAASHRFSLGGKQD